MYNLIIVNCKLELKNMGKNEFLFLLVMERKNKVEYDNIKDEKNWWKCILIIKLMFV